MEAKKRFAKKGDIEAFARRMTKMKDQWLEFFVVYENERTKKVHIHIRNDQDESEGFQLAAAAAKKAYDVAPIHMIQFVRAAESIEELTGKEVTA